MSHRTFTVGVIGGGQLARMMYAPAISLGISFKVLARDPADPAALVGHDVTIAAADDVDAVVEFARGCDVVTFDHEQVPASVLSALSAAGIVMRPGPEALLYAQDKSAMRSKLSELDVPCPGFRVVADSAELAAFADEFGWPVIAKHSRGGYDGKGVWRLANHAELAGHAEEIFATQPSEAVVLAEEFVDFAQELSALVCRSPSGQAVAYPISRSVQTGGVCTETITPAPDLDPDASIEAQRLALNLAHQLDVVGILAVELMQRKSGEMVVNELAMRPHNTGHWSIDGAHTSQFDNHLRAVVDLPLGDPKLRDQWSVMVNVLGGSVDDLASALLHCFARDRRLRVELYAKEVRPGRKVGHVVCTGDELSDVLTRARHAAGYLMGASDS